MKLPILLFLLAFMGGAFATVIPACAPTILANTEYTLTGDITLLVPSTACINISSNTNVSIDCQGYKITGDNSTGSYGIYSTGTFSTIKNCIISNFSSGIRFGANSATARNNTITLTYDNAGAPASCPATGGYCSGIYLTGSSNSLITNNSITGILGTLQYIGTNSDNNYTDNTISGKFYPYGDYDTAANNLRTRVINNTFSISGNYAPSYGLQIGGEDELYENNTLTFTVAQTGGAALGYNFQTSSRNITLRRETASTTVSGTIILASVAGADQTIDCQGTTWTGANATGSMGFDVAAGSLRTLIKDCNHRNLSGNRDMGTNTTIINITVNNTNTNGAAPYGSGVVFGSGGSGGLLANSTIRSAVYGIAIYPSTYTGLKVINNTFYSLTGVEASGTNSNNLFANNTIYLTTSGGKGFRLPYAISSSNFTNNTIIGFATGTVARAFEISWDGGFIFRDNTIINATAFAIAATAITVDCNSMLAGQTLIGNNFTSSYGIWSDQTFTTVKNCDVRWFSTQVSLNGNNGNISNVSTTGNMSSGQGINIYSDNNAMIENSTVWQAGSNAICLQYGNGNNQTLRYNNFTAPDSHTCLTAYTGSDHKVYGNTMTGTSAAAGYSIFNPRYNTGTYSNNTITQLGTSGYAINPETMSNSLFFNNTIYSNNTCVLDYAGGPTTRLNWTANNFTCKSNGFQLQYTPNSNNSFRDNTFTGFNAGTAIVIAGNANFTIIDGNRISNFIVGINLLGYNDTITNNNITVSVGAAGNSFGISSTALYNGFVENNTLTNADTSGGYGIYVDGGFNGTVSKNRISSIDQQAIYLPHGAASPTIKDNNASCSSCSGVLYCADFGSGVIVSRNIFTANTGQAYSTSRCYGSTATNNTFQSTTSYAVLSSSDLGSANTWTGNLFITNSTSKTIPALYLDSAHAQNLYNNTIYANATTAVIITTRQNDVKMRNNNITGLYWVNNSNASSTFNDSATGNNYWNASGISAYVMNGSVWTDSNANGYADGAGDYLNATNFPNPWIGIGGDFHPGAIPIVTDSITITALTVSPNQPKVSQNLNCNITLNTTFASANVSFSWLKNNVNQTALAGSKVVANGTSTTLSTLFYGNLSENDNWACSAYAVNGSITSVANISQNTTVLWIYHPDMVSSIFNSTLQSTSASFANFTTFNFTNPMGINTTYYMITTLTTRAITGIPDVAYQIFLDNVSIFNTTRTLGSGGIGSIMMQPAAFNLTAGTHSVAIAHARIGGGTIQTENATTVLFGMRDIDNNRTLNNSQTVVSNWTTSTTYQKLTNLTLTTSYNSSIVITSSYTLTNNGGSAGTTQYQTRLILANGTTNTCSTVYRYLTAGQVGSVGSSCAIFPDTLAGNQTIELWALVQAGMNVSYDGKSTIQAYGYVGESDNNLNKTDIMGATINTTWRQIINTTINIHSTLHDIFTFTSISGNATAAGNMQYQIFLYNSTGSNQSSLISYRRFGSIGQAGVALKGSLFSNLPSGTYRAELWASTTAGTITVIDGRLMVEVGDHTATSSGNTSPSILSANITPASPNSISLISCAVNATDAETSSLNIDYEWYLNGTNQTTLAGTYIGYNNLELTDISTLQMNSTTVGNWSCNVRAYDGTDYSPWFMSDNATVVVYSVSINCSITYPPGTPYTTLCNPWQQINAQCTDSEPPTPVRSITCNQYWLNGTLRNSISHFTASGFDTLFNFSLNTNDSGISFNYNCTGTVSTVSNTTTTVQAVVLGINQALCTPSGGSNATINTCFNTTGTSIPPANQSGTYFEIIGFWGLLCLALFGMAAFAKENTTAGLIGGILLVLMGVWLLGSPIIIKTGQNSVTSQVCALVNGNQTTVQNATNLFYYTQIQTPIFNINQSLGIVFCLVGLWACYKYSFALLN